MASLALGVGCGPSAGTATLTITTPTDGASITLADDQDSVAAGIQYTVTAQSANLADGTAVNLVDQARPTTPLNTAPAVVMGNAVTFNRVTLPSGTYRIVAQTTTGGTASAPVQISVNAACATITFVTPTVDPMSSSLRLGPRDDVAGMDCGTEFAINVAIATDAPTGRPARLFVNNTMRASATVTGGAVQFPRVVLGNRGTMANSLRVEVEAVGGVVCRQDFAQQIFVQCAGPERCEITAPPSGTLNATNDTSAMTAGFQTDILVDTDALGAANQVSLALDGALNPLTATPVVMGMGGRATFGNVTLTDGPHQAQATCRDNLGNVVQSGIAMWTVDTVGCPVTLTAPTANQLFIDSDDVDTMTPDFQINVTGTTTGSDCNRVRYGACGGIGAAPFTALTGTDLMGTVTLSSSPMQSICAEVQDMAGNISRGTVDVRRRTMGPQLEIVSPVAGTRFNKAGGMFMGNTYVADLDAATAQCDVDIRVNCTEIGQNVEILQEGSTAVLAMAPCAAMGGLPSPFVGQATFRTPLPLQESSSIVARQTNDRLTGTSSPIAVSSDCDLPSLAIVRPTCGALLRPSDDEVAGTPGFQYRVQVVNANTPRNASTLTVRTRTSVVYTSSTPTTNGAQDVFAAADFGSGGELQLTACATDSSGNEGCTASCAITVADLPAVALTAPAAGANLTASADCDAGMPGLQIQVTATSDAAGGQAATIQVGSAPAIAVMTGTRGSVSACVPAADGRNVPVRVTVTDLRGTGSATSTVNIASSPPAAGISDLAITIQSASRRAGVGRLSWTAVADGSGGTLVGYQLRCASAAITSEALWTSATAVSLSTLPAAAPTAQTADVPGFAPAVTRFCTLRGLDFANQLTPLGNSPSARVDLLEREVTTTAAATQLGLALVPVGDVNGDGIDDALFGGAGSAYLYLGNATALPATPSVVFVGQASTAFGRNISGLGDVNGDGLDDFAIGARAEAANNGSVYVFFGRRTWTTPVTITAPACVADICYRSGEVASFGFSIAGAGDFDGDGFGDLAIGATGFSSNSGKLYVLRGASTAGADGMFGTADDVAGGRIVSVPSDNPSGFVVVSSTTGLNLGASVSSLGGSALGNDALDDLVVTGTGTTGTANAQVFTLAGRAYTGPGLVSIPLASLGALDSGAGNSLGGWANALGDFNGDTFLDFGVYVSSPTQGALRVYLGSATGYSASSVLAVTNAAGGNNNNFANNFGLGRHPALRRLGDVDGDGRADIWAGSAGLDAGTLGVAQLFYGATGTANIARTAASITFSPAGSTAATQRRVAAYVGDLNGDGAADLAVGDGTQATNAGRVIILY